MEASINMRVFKTILLLAALAFATAHAKPMTYTIRHHLRDRETKPEAEQPKEQQLIDHYDQRQNGTENYRVKVDGLVFILAPADSLLLAGANLDPSFASLLPESNKPKPKPDKDEILKPIIAPGKDDFPKSAETESIHAGHKPSLRITDVLAPFLKRLHHLHQSQK